MANNSRSPGTKSLLSTSELLPNLLEEEYQPTFTAKPGLCVFQTDPRVLTSGLPGGTAKTRPIGHRHGRPPRLFLKSLLSAWSDRPEGHRRGCPPNIPHLRQTNVKILDIQTKSLKSGVQ